MKFHIDMHYFKISVKMQKLYKNRKGECRILICDHRSKYWFLEYPLKENKMFQIKPSFINYSSSKLQAIFEFCLFQVDKLWYRSSFPKLENSFRILTIFQI